MQEKSTAEIPENWQRLANSERSPSSHATAVGPVDAAETITVTVIVRRRPGSRPMTVQEFTSTPRSQRRRLSREEFAATHGAAPEELEIVAAFARSQGLEVIESDSARRSVEVRGTAAQINSAFAVALHHYESPRRKYRGFAGAVHLPPSVSEVVESVIGLDNRPVPAKRWGARRGPADPPGATSLTPAQVAQLYSFPAGNGAGQTIGIYEMAIPDENNNVENPGYTVSDVSLTLNAFGGGLAVPTLVDVSVDGQVNAGVSDGETVLDITVSGAIAQGATIAVYFTGPTNQNIIHALQRMIHPTAGDPVPSVISISYGLSPDDETSSITTDEYNQMDQLFQDAAHLDITVFVSSGDSGAMFDPSVNQAQASFPATDPWVTACGGTTIGDISGATFEEFVWNDTFGSNSGATGGGVSVLFNSLPSYQQGIGVPTRVNTGTIGRGIPDIAGNASPNSGYAEFGAGQSIGPTGGTSAVAPLYAGLIAVINANLGKPAGFINPVLYSMPATGFKDTLGAPGPANNTFNGVTGYPAGPGWDACTGRGSVIGTALQSAL
jgi:kumamolisin